MKQRTIIKKELADIAEKYGDERRTRVVKGGAKVISVEDLIPDEEQTLVLTQGGYIKRTNPSEYKKQKRGGVGVVDLNTKDEDFVTRFLTASTHSDLLFFTDQGKVYQTKMYDVPEGRRATKGKSVANFLPLVAEERITSVLEMPKEVKKSDGVSIMMVTKEGTVKKVAAENFFDVRRSGIIAINLSKGDQLVSVNFVEKKDTVIVTTEKGQSIHFNEGDVRAMGRSAAGVRGMKLAAGDVVIASDSISHTLNKAVLLTVTENGYGKKTDIKEYKVQKRGGSGVKAAAVTTKTGKLMTAVVVTVDEAEVVAMSKKGQVIRVDVSEIPQHGRTTQGVKVMRLRSGDSVVALICL